MLRFALADTLFFVPTTIDYHSEHPSIKLITLIPLHTGNTTEFSDFGGMVDEPSCSLMDMAMADDVTGGFDWYRPVEVMGEVTRGVPSLADLATADEVSLPF